MITGCWMQCITVVAYLPESSGGVYLQGNRMERSDLRINSRVLELDLCFYTDHGFSAHQFDKERVSPGIYLLF